MNCVCITNFYVHIYHVSSIWKVLINYFMRGSSKELEFYEKYISKFMFTFVQKSLQNPICTI